MCVQVNKLLNRFIICVVGLNFFRSLIKLLCSLRLYNNEQPVFQFNSIDSVSNYLSLNFKQTINSLCSRHRSTFYYYYHQCGGISVLVDWIWKLLLMSCVTAWRGKISELRLWIFKQCGKLCGNLSFILLMKLSSWGV